MSRDDGHPPRAARKKPWTRPLVAFIVVAVGLLALTGYLAERFETIEPPTIRIVGPVDGARVVVGQPITVTFFATRGRGLSPPLVIVSLARGGAFQGRVVVRPQAADHDASLPYRATLGRGPDEPGEHRVEVSAFPRRVSLMRGLFHSWGEQVPPIRAAVTVEAVR